MGMVSMGFGDTELNPKPRRPKTIHLKMCEYIYPLFSSLSYVCAVNYCIHL